MTDLAVWQILDWGGIRQRRRSPAGTAFVNTGRRLYVIGDIDGSFRPRTNPYDLHAYGKARPDDPLANKLQGVWAQPVKGLSGYTYTIEVNGAIYPLVQAETFTQRFASAQFDYRITDLLASRVDFAAQDLPLLFSTLTLNNEGSQAVNLRVTFTAVFDLEDAWFTTLAERPNTGQKVTFEADCLVARAEAVPDCWAAAVQGVRAAESARVEENSGELVYYLHLEPGEAQALAFGMAVESAGGADAAIQLLSEYLPDYKKLLEEKQNLYQQLYDRGPKLVSPDAGLNAAFDLARANLQMLEAQSPALGRYFYAGLEIFPFWFSNDGAYSTPGLLASGFREATLNHIRIGAEYQKDGRVPHQISPSGSVAFAGNAEETQLWVRSIWNAYRWTGDRAFLEALYPAALKGLFEYVLGTIDPDQDGYPLGPGMVEAEGMGAEKLDSAAYTWAALRDLVKMAEIRGDRGNAEKARMLADSIASRFDADWWDEPGGSYAMSLTEPGNQRYPVPHWGVVIPLEVGLATPEHAAATFATIRAHYLNQWGIKHTVGEDERVWTLPTALLSRAAFRYGEAEMGLEMLRHIAETLNMGSIGMFHELIPEGACFLQLWSAAAFIRGVIEDLLGIEVHAERNAVRLYPNLPAGWEEVRLENLVFGEHRISVTVSKAGINVEELPGSKPFNLL